MNSETFDISISTLEHDQPMHAEGIHDKVHGDDRGQQQGRGRRDDPAVPGSRGSRE